MYYVLILLMSFAAFSETTFICEIDDTNVQYDQDEYLIIEIDKESKITSVNSMPLLNSHYDEFSRRDVCLTTQYTNIVFCHDSNRFNITDPVYLSFDKHNKSVHWYGKTYNPSSSIYYNCILAK